MVDENLNTELPESSEVNSNEPEQKSLTAEDVKAIINEIAPVLLYKLKDEIQREQGKFNKSLLDKVNGNIPNFNLEETIKHFLEVDLSDVLINYSDVANSRVRKQLVIDNMLMEKHRLGLIEGAPNFYEFCKYAHSQIEELLNYYFHRRFPNIADFNEHFKKYKSTGDDLGDSEESFDKFSSVTECSWFQKHSIFLAEKQIKLNDKNENGRSASTRANINKVRNKYLHRSTITNQEDDEVLTEYLKHKPEEFGAIRQKLFSERSPDEKELLKLESNYFLITKTIRMCNWHAVRGSVKNLFELMKQDKGKFK